MGDGPRPLLAQCDQYGEYRFSYVETYVLFTLLVDTQQDQNVIGSSNGRIGFCNILSVTTIRKSYGYLSLFHKIFEWIFACYPFSIL